MNDLSPILESTLTPATHHPVPRDVGLRALLVSGEIPTIDTVCHALQQTGIHVEICSATESALRKLCHAKFEAVIVDVEEGSQTIELIAKLRGMTSHKRTVAIALVRGSNKFAEASRSGATVVLQHPLTEPMISKTLQATYPLMAQEKRRYFRCPLRTVAYLQCASGPEFPASAANISEGGMAVVSPHPIRVGEQLSVRLQLPGAVDFWTVNAEVCWSDGSGRVGLEFVSPSTSTFESLQSWLSRQLPEQEP